MAQWLRLCVPNAGGTGSIPGRGTKVLHATWRGKKKTTRKKDVQTINLETQSCQSNVSVVQVTVKEELQLLTLYSEIISVVPASERSRLGFWLIPKTAIVQRKTLMQSI